MLRKLCLSISLALGLALPSGAHPVSVTIEQARQHAMPALGFSFDVSDKYLIPTPFPKTGAYLGLDARRPGPVRFLFAVYPYRGRETTRTLELFLYDRFHKRGTIRLGAPITLTLDSRGRKARSCSIRTSRFNREELVAALVPANNGFDEGLVVVLGISQHGDLFTTIDPQHILSRPEASQIVESFRVIRPRAEGTNSTKQNY